MQSRSVCLILVLLFLALPAAAMDLQVVTTTPTVQIQTVRIVTIPATTVTTNAVGAISIASIPSGATVIIDGSVMGTTPYTIRTLTAGTHSLVLQLNGYQDYVTDFTVTPDTLNQLTCTLAPVTTATTTPPGVAVLTATVTTTPELTSVTAAVSTAPARATVMATPVPTISPAAGSRNQTAQSKLPRQVSVQPLTITVGNHTRYIRLSTMSPYFDVQFANPGTSKPDLPSSYIEVDAINVYLPGSSVMSNAEMVYHPVWGDNDSIIIDTTDKFFNNTNFRWITDEKGVTGFYQVSSFPFSSNATEWQDKYVPGLVSSGPVKDLHVDSEGFHYFSLNFAPIANHNPGDPPFYTGVVQLDQTVPGQGTPMDVVRIPATGVGISLKKIHAGPISFPFPAGILSIPEGEHTGAELGNPSEGMILSTTGDSATRISSLSEAAIASLPKTYWVRVVPIYSNGTAGIPTLPVTVTVARPTTCEPMTDTQQNIVVKPPSATVASFYMTSFVPDWIHTDQNGKLVSRAHFVTVSTPPYCTAVSGGTAGLLNGQLCAMYGGSEPGYHFYADPAESHWYDTVWDIITGLFSAWSQVINAASAAWNEIQTAVVEIAAYAVQGLTLGAFDCNNSPACTAVLRTGLSIAESSLGIPPTIPNAADLQNMGADYMAKVAADELGAGGVLDTAENVYNGLPDNVQDKIKDNSAKVGTDIANALPAQTGAAQASAAGSFYIPDPLYYSAHPAYAMVRVTNPNNEATDPVTMIVTDSAGLYKSVYKYVPSIAPHDSTVIPVILEEDYSKLYTQDCNANYYTSTNGIPCYWNLWWGAAVSSSWNGGDTLSVRFASDKEGHWITLTPSSSGKVVSENFVVAAPCEGNTTWSSYQNTVIVTYPSGWQMQTNGLTQKLTDLMWNNYQFTEGARGRLINGS